MEGGLWCSKSTWLATVACRERARPQRRRRRKCHPARSPARPREGVNKPFVCTASLTIITSLYNVWITFAKCQRPRARLPSPRTARQPKLTSIGKSDLSARPKRKYASLRNDGQINETGSSAHCHQLPKSKMFSIQPSIKLYYCKKMMK